MTTGINELIEENNNEENNNEENFTDLLKFNIHGTPVLVKNLFNTAAQGIYGRVIDSIKGAAEYKGHVARVNVYTPHGSIIEVGILHLEELNKNGMEKLQEFEKIAFDDGVELYKGKYTPK